MNHETHKSTKSSLKNKDWSQMDELASDLLNTRENLLTLPFQSRVAMMSFLEGKT